MKAEVRILEGKHLDRDQLKILKKQAVNKLSDACSYEYYRKFKFYNTYCEPRGEGLFMDRLMKYPEEGLMVMGILQKMKESHLFGFEALLKIRNIVSVNVFRRTPITLLVKVVTEDPHNSMQDINEILKQFDFETEKRVMNNIDITVDIVIKPVQIFRKMLEA